MSELSHADRDILMLPGLSRKIAAALRQRGFHTVGAIVAASVGALDEVPGIGVKSALSLKRHATAYVENRPLRIGTLPPICLQNGLMFDLETDPFTTAPWSLGWIDLDGVHRVVLIAEDRITDTFYLPDGTTAEVVSTTDAAWGRLRESAGATEAPIYHWTGYDPGIMRRSAPSHITGALMGRMHDLHATFKRTVALPQRSLSLKPVARYLGFEWPEGAEGGAGWQLAWNDFCRWRVEGDLYALSRACRYQRADTAALQLVQQWLCVNHLKLGE